MKVNQQLIINDLRAKGNTFTGQVNHGLLDLPNTSKLNSQVIFLNNQGNFIFAVAKSATLFQVKIILCDLKNFIKIIYKFFEKYAFNSFVTSACASHNISKMVKTNIVFRECLLRSIQ